MSSTAEHFHFLSILAHTYDSSLKNMRITMPTYRFRDFIAAFRTERVPGMPLSGISTRSGDLARFSFKNLIADPVDRTCCRTARACRSSTEAGARLLENHVPFRTS